MDPWNVDQLLDRDDFPTKLLDSSRSCMSTVFRHQTCPASRQDPVCRTVDVYDSIASAYASTWFDDPVMEPLLAAFVSRLPAGPVLDAGCGPGRDVVALERRGFTTIGVDLSAAMIAEARQRCPVGAFQHMDMRALEFPSEHFVGVWACASLQHLPDGEAQRALDEFARVLRRGGFLMLVVKAGSGDLFDHLGRYVRLYDDCALTDLLARSRFVIEQWHSASNFKETLGPGQTKHWIHCLARVA